MRQFFQRFMYWKPWEVTEPWKLGVQLGCDEFHNSSIMLQLPFLGCFIFFYNRRFQQETEHLHGMVEEAGKKVVYGKVDSNCEICMSTLGYFVVDDFT